MIHFQILYVINVKHKVPVYKGTEAWGVTLLYIVHSEQSQFHATVRAD